MLASILNLAANLGYPSVFLLIMAESAGIPLPGETALVTGALLASQHKLQIPVVIGLATSAAIIGDNLGYLIGRKGGRWLLERPGPFARSRRHALNAGVPFFDRHGQRAVFFGRWLIVACAPGHRGSPVPPACPGSRLRHGTRSGASAGQRRSGWPPTSPVPAARVSSPALGSTASRAPA